MSLINPAHLDELREAAAACPPGALVEVGVYRGGSAARLAEVAQEQGRALWLFDTFTGIPEATEGVDRHRVGDFADTDLREVRASLPHACIVVGDARETVPDAETGPVAFAHVDCDQYETTRDVIRALIPRMVRGGMMVFDDYGCLDGATRAVDEMIGGIELSAGGKARVRF